MSKLPVILAITGASGAPYGVRLLEVLATHSVPTWLLISSHGWRLLAEECAITDDKQLKKATEAGALVLPAAPGFYHKPQQVRDLVDFVVQRILDQLEIDVRLVKRWGGE